MPTLNQNLNILRNGLQRKKYAQDKESGVKHLPGRDHFERWMDFNKRQSPRSQQIPWTALQVLEMAVAAQRDTPMGIIDTVTREYITHWAPEIMLLEVSAENTDTNRDRSLIVAHYKSLFDDLQNHFFDVLRRIDCGKDKAAEQLKSVTIERARYQLRGIYYELSKHDLRDEERDTYDPNRLATPFAENTETSRKKVKLTTDPISEARILNSAVVWDTHDTHKSSSELRDSVAKEMAQIFTTTSHEVSQSLHVQPLVAPSRKRRHSQTRSSPEPDPADNGQVWDSLMPDTKRRRFEFKFTDTVRLSAKNGNGRQPRFEVHSTTPRKRTTVDLTMDGSDGGDENEYEGIYRFKEGGSGASEFSMPGAFYWDF